MSNETVQRRPYLKLLLLAGLLGITSAVFTFGFMWLVGLGEGHWGQAAQAIGLSEPIFTLVVCTIGGLLVGVLVKIFGDHTGIFAEMMQEFGHTGRFEYRNAPGIVIVSFVSLITGGSLGPEAPMADACGGIGTWLSDRLKMDEQSTRSLGFSGLSGMLASFITSPFGGALLGMESTRSGIDHLWTLFPSLVASAFATTIYILLSGTIFGSLYTFPDYEATVTDLLLAVPLGLVGALAGAIFILLFHQLRRVMLPLKRHLILRSLIGGIVLGVAGAVMPLILFSGEEQTAVLIETSAELGVLTLIGLALVKVIVTSLLLATGWKGGYIFPIMFAGVALGLAIHLIFPSIPMAVAVASTMGGAMVAIMKAPIFSALFVLLMIQPQAAPVIAIAVTVSLLATARLSMTAAPSKIASRTQVN